MLAVEFGGQALHLLGEGAIWWAHAGALLVSDVHLGKAAAFRANGLPVPEAVTDLDLARLSRLVERTGARRLIVLGDMVHNAEWERAPSRSAILSWCERTARSCSVELVPGNHDRSARIGPGSLPITVHDGALRVGPLVLTHDPDEPHGAPTICGHVHPVFSCFEGPGGGIRSRCFWINRSRLIMPAFGRFTGGCRVRPEPDDRLFLIGPDAQVMELRAPARASR